MLVEEKSLKIAKILIGLMRMRQVCHGRIVPMEVPLSPGICMCYVWYILRSIIEYVSCSNMYIEYRIE